MKNLWRRESGTALITGLAALLAVATNALAGEMYFSGGNATNWDASSANWGTASGVYNTPWASGSDAVFEGTANTINAGTISAINSIKFNTDGYTIQGNSLTLTGAGGVVTTGPGTNTISSTLLSSVGFTKTGAGTLVLAPTFGASGTNITGDIVVQQGTLALGEAIGLNSTLSGPITINAGGTLQWNANDQTANTGTITVNGGTMAMQNYDQFMGQLVLKDGATVSGGNTSYILVNGTNNSVISATSGNSTIGARIAVCSQWSGAGGVQGARTQDFNVAEGASLNVSGSIIDVGNGSSFAGSISKSGAGLMTVSGQNTYTGTTTVNQGTLAIGGTVVTGDVMANAVNVNAGGTLLYTRTDGISNSATVNVNGGTMDLASYSDYVGSLALSNGGKVLGDGTVWSGSEADYAGNLIIVNGVGGGVISASGTGNAISSTVALTTQWAGTTGNRDQEFNVAADSDLTVSGVIMDTAYRSASFVGGVRKTGTGTLTLAGKNTYTGTTTVDAGTLVIGGSVENSDVLGSSVVVNSGATLYYGRTDGISNSGSLTVNGGVVNLANRSDYIGSLVLKNGGRVLGDGSAPLGTKDDPNGTGDQGYFNTGNFLFISSDAPVISATGANNQISSRIALTSVWVAPGDKTLTLDVANGGDLTISGVIANDVYRIETSHVGGILKSGDGKLTLSGHNTYTGNTTVSGGTLELANGGSMALDINSAGVSTQILGSGVFSANGLFAFDLNDVAGNGAWDVVANSLSKTYGNDFGVTFAMGSSVFTGHEVSAGVWAYTSAIGTATFYESNGQLVVTAVVPEPGTMALFASGLVGLIAYAWRKRK
jgi:fibronectin-binding autotransporter adhesin